MNLPSQNASKLVSSPIVVPEEGSKKSNFVAPPPPKEYKMHIYILAGASNMVGRDKPMSVINSTKHTTTCLR